MIIEFNKFKGSRKYRNRNEGSPRVREGGGRGRGGGRGGGKARGRGQRSGGSIANINADGTFTHVGEDDEDGDY